MSETKRESSVIKRAWQWLTEPSPRLTDPQVRERARLLSALLLLFMAVSLVGAAYVAARFSVGPARPNPELLMTLGIAAGELVAYLLNRRGAYLPAALLAGGLLAAGTFGATHLILSGALAPTYHPDDVNLLSYLTLSLIFAAILLPVWLTLTAGGCVAVGLLLVPVVHPQVSYSSIAFGPLLFLLVTAVFMMLIARYWQGVARRRQAALAETGERLRSLFEESLDPVLLIAADDTINAVNVACSKLFGYPRIELEGRHVRDLYIDTARHSEVVRKAERHGQLYEEPVKLKKRDGSVLDCLATIQLRRDGEGGVLEYQTIVRDVTGQLRTVEDLKLRSELIALAQDAVYLVDPAGEIVFANEALGKLTGYGVDELVGMNIRRLNTPEGAEQVPSRIGRMLREGELEFETVYVRKDGTQVDVEVRTRTIDSGGRTLLLSVGRDVTQRKVDEAELRMRGELLDSVHDSVFLHDLRGNFLYVNEAAAATLGYRREELLSLRVQQMSSPEHSVLFRRRIDVLLRKGSMAFESEYLRKDGSVLPVEVRAMLHESGEKTLVLCVARDIAERVRAERTLEAERDRARSYLDIAGSIILVLDADGRVDLINRSGCEILGYPEDEILGKSWFESFLPVWVRKDTRAVFDSLMAGEIESAGYHENPVVISNGEERLIAWHDTVLRESEKIVGILASGEDITEHREVYQALRFSEERYRSLFEQSREAINLVAPDGRVLDVNQAWLDLYGFSRDEIPGMNVVDVYANPEDREDFLRRIAETGLVEDEVCLKKKDGTVMDCLRTVVAKKDSQGNVVAYQGLVRDITEDKRAQQALQDSEEKFRSLFEQSREAISVVAPDGRILDVNQAWLDLHGYSRKELPGLKAADIYANPDDREDFLRRIAETGLVEDEVRFKKKDGTVMECQRTAVVRKDDKGNVVAYQGIARDITEEKRARQALKDSEEKYRSLFQQSMDAVSLIAVDGTILDANPAFWQLFREESGEAGTRNVRDYYEDPAEREHFVERMEREGMVVDDEGQLRRRDGSIMTLLRSSVARRDESGRIVAYLTVLHDITEQKKAEDVLRESEARFRELSELLPQTVCETDIDGNTTFVNRKALEVWGYSWEDLQRGINIRELIAPQDLQPAGVDFEAVLRGKGGPRGEYLALRRDGTVFPVEVFAVPRVHDGEVVGTRAVLIDITDRKKAEQQLHDLAAHIEEVREDERTGIARELHDRLAQALTAMKLDLADVKGRAEKGEAIPLGKLAGTMDLIDETAADVRRISSELRPGLLDDLGLVAAMEWQLSQFGERSGLKCRLDSRTDDSGLDRAHSTALFRIFQELLTNVARHADASRVRVSFEFDDGRYILMVADDGRGITEEEMNAPGSLGLIGMRERVRPFGGRIEIEGVPKGGTTVRVYVPAG